MCFLQLTAMNADATEDCVNGAACGLVHRLAVLEMAAF
jgi:hypothetical protein